MRDPWHSSFWPSASFRSGLIIIATIITVVIVTIAVVLFEGLGGVPRFFSHLRLQPQAPVRRSPAPSMGKSKKHTWSSLNAHSAQLSSVAKGPSPSDRGPGPSSEGISEVEQLRVELPSYGGPEASPPLMEVDAQSKLTGAEGPLRQRVEDLPSAWCKKMPWIDDLKEDKRQQEFEAQIAGLESQIKDLKTNNAKLEELQREQMSNFASLTTQKHQMEVSFKQKIAAITELRAEIAKLKSTHDEQSSTLARIAAKNHKLEAEIADLKFHRKRVHLEQSLPAFAERAHDPQLQSEPFVQQRAPGHWANCTGPDNIWYSRGAGAVELTGCPEPWSFMNGTYVQSPFHEVRGTKAWWKISGDVVIYVADSTEFPKGLCMLGVSRQYANRRRRIEQGNLFYYVTCPGVVDLREVHNRQWNVVYQSGILGVEKFTTLVALPPILKRVAPLMEMSFEMLDETTLKMFTEIIQQSVQHQTQHEGASKCDKFKERARVVRVLRVENLRLWMRYQSYLEQVREDVLQCGIGTDPDLHQSWASMKASLPEDFGDFEHDVAERLLFHGTDYNTAVTIATDGFDFRAGLKHGCFYGRGTYFTSQACKGHQYTESSAKTGLRAVILSRVIVGDVFCTDRVDTELRRPPNNERTGRLYDTVVAKPGPKKGLDGLIHRQAHTEFVIFEKYQAYPEFIIQYTCSH
ncbi:unnamed protein product [Prorocentrum cordatum]|uniref:Poly [ADP-ribose] polymerase n=1 Tax=Prorocentrum cordatum TaxID=2364126 RepID=A0ABN9T4M8_9DINO|nr:unnamed protein product [Polarella glacialis]